MKGGDDVYGVLALHLHSISYRRMATCQLQAVSWVTECTGDIQAPYTSVSYNPLQSRTALPATVDKVCLR